MTPYDVSATLATSGYVHGPLTTATAMGRWVVEATMSLACERTHATILEGLRSCSIIRTYLASTALAVAWTPYDVSATRAGRVGTRAVQGRATAMGKRKVETSTALACPSEAATTLEELRSCSIIRTYLAPRPSLWRGHRTT